MVDARTVKAYAKACGADLVGIASMDRFEGAPAQMDPRHIFPDAKAMIVLGFRILRGCLRGIEEGTFFIAYSGMGYAGINHVLQPMVLWSLCRSLEDEGYEAVPIPNNFPWNNTDVSGSDPARTGVMRPEWSRPVAPGKPAPDVFVHMRLAAFCAGLGEIGYGKLLLTPEYGPRQRLAAVLTDAPLEPDPLFEGGLCDRCLNCVRDCSGEAISATKTVNVTVAGRDLEWGEIDYEKCSRAFCGGVEAANPFMISPEDKAGFTQPVGRAQQYKLSATYDYGRALEGAAGCMRACMVHLEQQRKLSNRFHAPFRRRKPWRMSP